jgi:hypothetical protein
VVAGIEALKSSGESQQVAVVAAAQADSTAFMTWFYTSTPLAGVRAIGFDEIGLEIRITPHLIAYFPGDRLIEAEDVETLGREFLLDRRAPTGLSFAWMGWRRRKISSWWSEPHGDCW